MDPGFDHAAQDLWVFGYGSLIWRPGFDYLQRLPANIIGMHRSLCVYSFDHRGTPERPGLVLGLDRGGSCVGLAFKVPLELQGEVMTYLRERELVTNVYLERTFPVRLASGQTVSAICYIVDRAHVQYAGSIDEAQAASIVRGAVGQSGRNEDYVLSTIQHLEALGIRDHWIEEVARRIVADSAAIS